MNTKEIIASQQAINRKLWAKENGRMHSVDANRLIAEFMGFYRTEKGYIMGGFGDGNFGLAEELHFHTSWDWLMPVVEKINNTTDEFGNEMDFQIGNGFVWVDHPIGNRIYFSGNEIDHKKEPMIDKVYKAVVEFIKEYNKDYKTCDRCCYDIVDDDGDIMEHICIDDKLY